MELGGSNDTVTLRSVDRKLDGLRDEADQLDAMLLYLQRRRDEVEDEFCVALAQRDRLEAALWDDEPAFPRPRVAAAPDVSEGATLPKPPPDLSRTAAPVPLPAAAILLEEWGLDEDGTPRVPDLTGRHAPPLTLLGPLLESWELEEDAVMPVPEFIAIEHTLRMSVVPRGTRAPGRPSSGFAPRAVPLQDTAPIGTRRPVLARLHSVS